jgi:hypothetical protein
VVAKLARVRDHLRETPRTLAGAGLILQRMAAAAGDLVGTAEARAGGELGWWARAVEEQCRYALEELRYLTPWVELPSPGESMWRNADDGRATRLGELREGLARLDQIPSLGDIARLEITLVPAVDALLAEPSAAAEFAAESRDWLTLVRTVFVQAAERAAHRLAELRQLAARCVELADIDYEFLYDRERHLLAIGSGTTSATGGWILVSTTCSRRRRDSPATSQSLRESCRRSTGSPWAGS